MFLCFFFQAEDGIRCPLWSRGLGDVYKRQGEKRKKIIRKDKIFKKTKFFPDSKINYSENILKKKTEDIAVNFFSSF